MNKFLKKYFKAGLGLLLIFGVWAQAPTKQQSYEITLDPDIKAAYPEASACYDAGRLNRDAISTGILGTRDMLETVLLNTPVQAVHVSPESFSGESALTGWGTRGIVRIGSVNVGTWPADLSTSGPDNILLISNTRIGHASAAGLKVESIFLSSTEYRVNNTGLNGRIGTTEFIFQNLTDTLPTTGDWNSLKIKFDDGSFYPAGGATETVRMDRRDFLVWLNTSGDQAALGYETRVYADRFTVPAGAGNIVLSSPGRGFKEIRDFTAPAEIVSGVTLEPNAGIKINHQGIYTVDLQLAIELLTLAAGEWGISLLRTNGLTGAREVIYDSAIFSAHSDALSNSNDEDFIENLHLGPLILNQNDYIYVAISYGAEQAATINYNISPSP